MLVRAPCFWGKLSNTRVFGFLKGEKAAAKVDFELKCAVWRRLGFFFYLDGAVLLLDGCVRVYVSTCVAEHLRGDLPACA